MQTRVRSFQVILALAAAFFLAGTAYADLPSRIARMGYTQGAVSLSPAGQNEWVQAGINRPLTNGDRIWSDAAARAEIQVGSAMVRLDSQTSVSILNLDDHIVQLQLTQGVLSVHVPRLDPNQVFEIDTPSLAFTLQQPGDYRLTVSDEGRVTDVLVRRGQGRVNGEGAAYLVDSRQAYRFPAADLRDYQSLYSPPEDEFERWAINRDRALDASISARYVSPDLVGYQDLDASGTWRADPTYGNVWVPNHVAADWSPYSAGHWAWVDPWGWTWIDDAPWGFAVSHYGRWAHLRDSWGWVPGPRLSRAYYAPALVAFIGGSNFQISISSGSVGGVAWFPLGPRDVYRPAYPASRTYFENINRSNTVINSTVITNNYNTTVVNNVYANRGVPGAVIALPTRDFQQSQHVSHGAVKLTPDVVARVPVQVAAPLAPTEKNVTGANRPGEQPPMRVLERPVVAHTAPAAVHPGLDAQRPQLANQPGTPLDKNTRDRLKPAATAPVPMVRVLPNAPAPAIQIPPAAGPKEMSGRPAAPEVRERAGPPANHPPARLDPCAQSPAAEGCRPRNARDERDRPGAADRSR